MGGGVTLNIDQLRRKLRDTEKTLREAKAVIKSSKREVRELEKENQKLMERIHKAAGILLPDPQGHMIIATREY